MQTRHFHKSSLFILPPNPPISLIGSGWRCLESDSWEEKHHVFFSDSSDFCILTMSKESRLKVRSKIRKAGDWIIEIKDKGMIARARLQIIAGDYKQGIILLDCLPCETGPLQMILAQLLTSCFSVQRLDTLKVLPLNIQTSDTINVLLKGFERRLLTFTANEQPSAVFCRQFHLERDAWLESENGAITLDQLGWLQKRIQRESKALQFATQETKTPWLLSLLTMGRRRRRCDDMIHPLEQFRKKL
jgi:hypothetical protein